MITVLSVTAASTDEAPELKKFETLGGWIAKIENLGIELKIVDNFAGGVGGVNCNFPIFLRFFF